MHFLSIESSTAEEDFCFLFILTSDVLVDQPHLDIGGGQAVTREPPGDRVLLFGGEQRVSEDGE